MRGPRRQPSQTRVNGPRGPPIPLEGAEPPPLPPQNSIWHQQTEDALAATQAAHTQPLPRPPQDSDSTPSPARNIDQPASSSLAPELSSFGATFDTSRPISSATGIISLYGSTPDRRDSDPSSIDDDDDDDEDEHSSNHLSPRLEPPISIDSLPSGKSRPLSRPLPQLPTAPAPPTLLPLPQTNEGPSRSTSPYSTTTLSRNPSPQPYTVPLTPPTAERPVVNDYFSEESAPRTTGPAAAYDSLSPDLSASRIMATPGPTWSPMAPSFPSTDSSLSAARAGEEDSSPPRPGGANNSSNTSHWRSGSGDVLGRGGSPQWQRGAPRQIPHLRVDSAPETLPKKRALLPPLPSVGGSQDTRHRRQDEDDESVTPVQTTAPASLLSFQSGTQYPDHSSSYPTSRPPDREDSRDSWQSSDSQLRVHAGRQYGGDNASDSRYIDEKARKSPAGSALSQYSRNERFSRSASVNFALLSHLAMLLKDTVPRTEQVKGSIKYPSSFTGKDVVSTLQSLIPVELAATAAGVDAAALAANDNEGQVKLRRVALLVAKSLKAQMFFHEVDWGDAELVDGVEQVYMFLQDSMSLQAQEGGAPSSALAPSANHGTLSSSPRARPESLVKVLAFEETKLDLSFAFGPEAQSRRDHPVSSADFEELPTGVSVPLTTCYSPLCGRADPSELYACYSPSCPKAKRSLLKRGLTLQGAAALATGSDAQALPGAAGGVAHKAWAELVPQEVLESLPKKEITRQNAILEHIQKEEDFLADLKLLETLFIRGLEKPNDKGDPPPLPVGPERDDFIREVFANHRELVHHVSAFVEKLQVRQREESPVIKSIGDLFLDAALEWQDAFIRYVANYPLAKSRIQREQSINPRFRDFVESCRRNPACRRLGLDNFIHRALPHLQRHPLLLQTIIDKTEEDNADRENCIRAKEVIVEQCKTADRDIAAAQAKAKIRGFAYNLHSKRNSKAIADLDLLQPDRQLIHEGRVYRKPDFTELEWTEMQAILFDNYFAITKMKTKQDVGDASAADAIFVLAKRPIPVEMLEVSGFADPSVSFSIGLNALHFKNERESRDLWPFTVHHIGGKIEPLTLYAPSKQKRTEWRTKFDEAKGLRRAVVEANRVFELTTLCDATFALPYASVGMVGGEIERSTVAPGSDNSSFHGRITCSVPFTMADNRRLVALGCADGVWIGLRNDPSSYRKVLHLKLVTQCAVLEQFGTFVVLADRVLIAYSLEALVPASTGGAFPSRAPQKLSGNRGVLFFGIGTLRDRTLLVYVKKKANESVFKALEPVLNQSTSSDGKSGGGFFKKLKDDIGKNSDWFRMYKVSCVCAAGKGTHATDTFVSLAQVFFIPSEAYSMQFLRSKLAILCARGFEIMNLDTLLPGTIPDFTRASQEDPRILHLARRVESSKPLGMFKLAVEGDFLLCFDGFACYVDRSGEPIKLDNMIEWEGSPHSVSYSPPYILAFDNRFIEVRDASTGRLVQILRGSEFRCVSANSMVEGVSSHADGSSAIIGVQRRRVQGKTHDTQHIFELVQTAPPQTPTTGGLSSSSSATTAANLSRKDTSATFATFTTNSSGLLSDSASTYLTNSTRSRPSYGTSAGSSGISLTRNASKMTLTDPPAPAGWI